MVAFDDDATADEFVEAVSRPGGFFFLGKDGHFRTTNNDESATKAFVRGMWQRPTKFCDCGITKANKKPYARSKKYGWWVHKDCAKPEKLWADGEHYYYSLGTNLLPVSADAPEWRGNGVYGHNWDENTKQWIHHETGLPWNPEEEGRRLRERLGFLK